MSLSCRFERSLVNHDEHAIVLISHHPAIYEAESDALRDARKQLRALKEREGTFARQNRRAARGKAEQRGGNFPGTYERPKQRKQVFAAAIKRINGELDRRTKIEARNANVEAARKALALRRAANFTSRPAAGDTANPGLNPLSNARRRHIVTGKRIGSVSQAVKASQARRDSR
jgi:type II secretory pathway component PulJ